MGTVAVRGNYREVSRREDRPGSQAGVVCSLSDKLVILRTGGSMSSSLDYRDTIEAQRKRAQIALTIMRVGLGSLFVSVFLENRGKGLYSPSGYSGLINYYIEKGHGPQLLKSVMAIMASHASFAGPMQAVTEISFGVLLIIGLLTRPVALAAFLFLT